MLRAWNRNGVLVTWQQAHAEAGQSPLKRLSMAFYAKTGSIFTLHQLEEACYFSSLPADGLLYFSVTSCRTAARLLGRG